MATTLNKLTAVEARTLGEGLHSDGGGLMLQVGGDGARSWIFRYRLAGRRREMGLGSFAIVGLAAARQKAQDARQLIARGQDPIEARKAHKRAQRPRRGITFAQAAARFIEAQEAGWRNPHHRKQWRDTIRMYAAPRIGKMDVAAIDTADVLGVLQPIWLARTETASRLRGRIERILWWAKAQGFRDGPNPAQWKGHLDNLLPARTKVHRVTHLPAMPYADVPAFIGELRRGTGITARALELTILTACRVNEAAAAQWSEMGADVWEIPGARTKSGRVHRVPLSDRAAAVVAEMKRSRMSQWVFPGIKTGTHLSGMAMLQQLRRMRPQASHGKLTVHGFRSSFKDWCSEQTAYPDFLSEMALGHVSGDKVRAAYARSELMDKRREMMCAWAEWCEPPTCA